MQATLANADPGADLETWEAQIHACEQRCEGVHDDKRVTTIVTRQNALDRKIARTETTRPRGLAVKVRRLRVSFDEGEADWDKVNFRTLLASIERMEG